MAQHINGKCNLSELNGKQVDYVSTDQYALTQTLKDTGKVVIVTSNEQFENLPYVSERHDIYVAGEHIAGGYGFDEEQYVGKITYFALDNNYDAISYIIENNNAIKHIVSEYNKTTENESDVEVTTPDNSETSFVIGNTTYTLTTNEYDKLYFEKECDTRIFDVNYVLDIIEDNVISNDPLIVKVGTPVNFLQFSLNIEGTNDITHLDLFKSSEWEKLLNSAAAVKGAKYSEYAITTDKFDSIYYLQDNNYSHTLSLGSNVDTLQFINYEATNDAPVIVYKDSESKKNSTPKYVEAKRIYWQVPYFYGTTEFTADAFNTYGKSKNSVAYRNDTKTNTMYQTEFTIKFNTQWKDRTYGYIAIPVSWCTDENGNEVLPTFTYKQSNIKCNWKRTSTSQIQCVLGDKYINYYVFKTPQQYYGGEITWILS